MTHVFLLVDGFAEGRTLLRRALSRRFPDAVFCETGNAETAVALAQKQPPTAAIVHRTCEHSGAALVSLFRAAGLQVPLVLICERDDVEQALAAGASGCLGYDQWPRLGQLVEELTGVAPRDVASAVSFGE